jgi:hypothetical protein
MGQTTGSWDYVNKSSESSPQKARDFLTRQMAVHCFGFEILITVAVKSTAFWDISTFNPIELHRRFGGTYCLHLQGEV